VDVIDRSGEIHGTNDDCTRADQVKDLRRDAAGACASGNHGDDSHADRF
jgi:hypothetical protein